MAINFPGKYYQFTNNDILPDGTIASKVPEFVKVLYLKEEIRIQFYTNAMPSFCGKETKGGSYYNHGKNGDYIIQFNEQYSVNPNEFYVVSKSMFLSAFKND